MYVGDAVLALGALLFLPSFARPESGERFNAIRERFNAIRAKRSSPTNALRRQLTSGNTITEWTAMGDSYAAGIGIGNALNDYCLRYDGGYASIVNTQLQPQPPLMNFTACSGDLLDTIQSSQFSDTSSFPRYAMWGNKPEFVTIHLGGNDIGFKELVTRCIYGIILFTLFQSCDDVIRNSQKLVHDPEVLDNKVFNVIVKALSKAQQRDITNFKVYVLGYAQFFNETREQCNQVQGFPGPSWLTLRTPGYLTSELRGSLNKIARDLNTGIQSAVLRANITSPGKVVYVPIDDLYNGHRFCDHDEPNARNPDTWFITYDEGSEVSSAGEKFFNSIPQIHAVLSNSSNAQAVPPAQFIELTAQALGNSSATNRSLEAQAGVDLVDVFHPTLPGHKAIAERLRGVIVPPAAVASA